MKSAMKAMEESSQSLNKKAEADVQHAVKSIKKHMKAAPDNNCIQKAGALVDVVAENGLKEVYSCSPERLVQAREIYKEMKLHTFKERKRIAEKPEEVDKCNNLPFFQGLKCKIDRHRETGHKKSGVTTSMAVQVLRATGKIIKLKIAMEACIRAKAAETISNVNQISTEIEKCS